MGWCWWRRKMKKRTAEVQLMLMIGCVESKVLEWIEKGMNGQPGPPIICLSWLWPRQIPARQQVQHLDGRLKSWVLGNDKAHHQKVENNLKKEELRQQNSGSNFGRSAAQWGARANFNIEKFLNQHSCLVSV
jgi:hypothetical protein